MSWKYNISLHILSCNIVEASLLPLFIFLFNVFISSLNLQEIKTKYDIIGKLQI